MEPVYCLVMTPCRSPCIVNLDKRVFVTFKKAFMPTERDFALLIYNQNALVIEKNAIGIGH